MHVPYVLSKCAFDMCFPNVLSRCVLPSSRLWRQLVISGPAELLFPIPRLLVVLACPSAHEQYKHYVLKGSLKCTFGMYFPNVRSR